VLVCPADQGILRHRQSNPPAARTKSAASGQVNPILTEFLA
jgi:hypothetical protein